MVEGKKVWLIMKKLLLSKQKEQKILLQTNKLASFLEILKTFSKREILKSS